MQACLVGVNQHWMHWCSSIESDKNSSTLDAFAQLHRPEPRAGFEIRDGPPHHQVWRGLQTCEHLLHQCVSRMLAATNSSSAYTHMPDRCHHANAGTLQHGGGNARQQQCCCPCKILPGAAFGLLTHRVLFLAEQRDSAMGCKSALIAFMSHMSSGC